MAILHEMTPKLSAVIRDRCTSIVERAAVSYWGQHHGSDIGFHLRSIDQNFRDLARALGYSLCETEPAETAADADPGKEAAW